jgi:hypothetical protein
MGNAMTAIQLSHALNAAIHAGSLLPSDELHRNEVGNLAVIRDGDYVGWVDLRFGEVTMFEGSSDRRFAEAGEVDE